MTAKELICPDCLGQRAFYNKEGEGRYKVRDCPTCKPPDRREDIATILKPLTKNYVLSYIHNLNQLETEIKRVEDYYVNQIIALGE